MFLRKSKLLLFEMFYTSFFNLVIRHVVPWSNCIEEIIPAKNRLVTYLEEVCANQELANRQLGASRSNESISKLRSAKGLDIKASLAEVPVHRGIVYTGKSCHIKDIYQSIYAVRKIIRSTIDIEVWVNLRDMDTCKQILEKAFHVDDASQGYVRCQELPSGIKGFTSKFYALLLSSFTDALFIDSDNVPVRDVNAIFDSEGYRSTGIVLWPDLWGDRCRYARPLPPHGETAFETFVLYAANFPSKSNTNQFYSLLFFFYLILAYFNLIFCNKYSMLVCLID